MLQPKKTRYRKYQKGRNRGIAQRGYGLTFGEYGLKSLEHGVITSRQIEAIRVCMNRIIGKDGKLCIRIFPDKPITRKPAGVRMGSGKGNVEFYGAVVKPGTVLVELGQISRDIAKLAIERASDKLPIKVKMMTHKDNVELR